MKTEPADAWLLAYRTSNALDESSPEPPQDGRTYTLIPSRDRPRFYIDEAGWPWAAQLAVPTRLSRRLSWRLLTSLGQLRFVRRLLPRFEVPPGYSLGPIEDLIGRPVDALSMMLGSEGPERKVVAQVVAGRKIVGYLKITDDDTGRWLLRNERRMLEHASRSLPGLSPRVLAFREESRQTFLLSTPVSGKPSPHRLTAAHVGFLRALWTGRFTTWETTDVHARILDAARLHPRLLGLSQALNRRCGSTSLRTATTQGDFAPWNLRLSGAAVRAIDWEYGTRDGIAGIDAVHFIVNTAHLLERTETVEITQALEEYATGERTLLGVPEGYGETERFTTIVSALLFDVATGLVATRGDLTQTNRLKLQLASSLLEKR